MAVVSTGPSPEPGGQEAAASVPLKWTQSFFVLFFETRSLCVALTGYTQICLPLLPSAGIKYIWQVVHFLSTRSLCF